MTIISFKPHWQGTNVNQFAETKNYDFTHVAKPAFQTYCTLPETNMAKKQCSKAKSHPTSNLIIFLDMNCSSCFLNFSLKTNKQTNKQTNSPILVENRLSDTRPWLPTNSSGKTMERILLGRDHLGSVPKNDSQFRSPNFHGFDSVSESERSMSIIISVPRTESS